MELTIIFSGTQHIKDADNKGGNTAIVPAPHMLPKAPDSTIPGKNTTLSIPGSSDKCISEVHKFEPKGAHLDNGVFFLVYWVGDLGYASELRNYAEYSGAPNEEEVLQYARVELDCATANPDGRKRALLIRGGIANFTDDAATFSGIIRALREKDLPFMLFSTDEVTNKAVIYAGMPPSAANSFKVLDWLTPSIAPLKGKGGGGKNGIAQGQRSHFRWIGMLCQRQRLQFGKSTVGDLV
ncbi:hypothetical protein ABZP36_029834 [Zizania latifolia]